MQSGKIPESLLARTMTEETNRPASERSGAELEEQAIRGLTAAYQRMRQEIGKVIIGQDEVVDQLLIAMFAKGHCLLVGVPGLAKTLLCSTIASILQLSFRRIQFTPDLMPSDITGTDVLQDDPETGRKVFQFIRGPLFTIGSNTYPLPEPFFTLATQNPIEQEGTYPLPEAQLDRFMFNVVVSYPTAAEELRILKQTTGSEKPELNAVLTGRQIQALQEVVYARDLVRASRPGEPEAPPFVKELVSWGAGPRAGQYLILGARAHALLQGRFHVTTDDIRAVAKPVLRHRIMTTFAAASQGVTPDVIIERLLKFVPVELQERAKKRVQSGG